MVKIAALIKSQLPAVLGIGIILHVCFSLFLTVLAGVASGPAAHPGPPSAAAPLLPQSSISTNHSPTPEGAASRAAWALSGYYSID